MFERISGRAGADASARQAPQATAQDRQPLFLLIDGDGGSNSLNGTAGDDVINGLGGGDTLSGRDGADVINGGNGDDFLYGSYFGVSLPPDGTTDVGDTLNGGNGADVLRGSDGDDLLFGGNQVDNLRGDQGDDTLNGGAGEDFAAYRFDDIGLVSGVVLDFSAIGSAPSVTIADGQGGTDTLLNIERGVITGSGFDDTITGGDIIEQLATAGGNDLINAGGGRDRILDNQGDSTLGGGAGDDSFFLSDTRWRSGDVEGGHDLVDGGSGTDTLELNWYDLTSVIRTVPGAAGVFDVFTVDGAFGVDTTSIERLVIHAGSGNDRILGAGGSDTFYGYLGSDSLRGAGGADILYGGGGADTLIGGTGYDRYVYLFEDANRLAGHELNALDFDTSGGSSTIGDLAGSTDQISGFEAVAMYGVFGNDVLTGSFGDDIIDGSFGADTLDGDMGRDIFQMWASGSFQEYDPVAGMPVEVTDGDDTVYGGDGLDTMDYSKVEYEITFDLEDLQIFSEGTGRDYINSIEWVIGGTADDLFIGSFIAETLDGGEGADSISGGGAKDRIIGGKGADTLEGGGAADTFIYTDVVESTAGESDLILALANADRINLSAIDANTGVAGNQAFVLAASLTGVAGQLVRSYDAGLNETTFAGDVDGDGIADLVIRVEDDRSGYSNFVL